MRGSEITVYNVYVKNQSGNNVNYADCESLETLCSIAMSDLLTDYDLVEDDRIEVQVTATNIYGTSDLSEIVEGSVKLVQTTPHKPSQSPMRGALTA
jgi:hypothetical protein